MEPEVEKFAGKIGLRLLTGEEVYRDGDGAVYRIPLEVNGEAFIVHSVQGALVASRPEVVGRELDSLVIHPARLVAGYLKHSGLADRKVVFMHVLRGSQGYRLDVALREAGFGVESQFVRVVYTGGSGEKHAEAKPRVASAQLTGLSGEEKTLVVADTVATGRTLKEALHFMLDVAAFKGVQFEKVVVYGFISESGARAVGEFLGNYGITPAFFALEDFAALASNQYDMPLYGPDIGAKGVDPEKTIAGVSVPEALRAMLGEYFPGMDQPGDWSERQCLLFNGYGYERGRIGEHLERSLKSLETLHSAVREASWYEEWLEEVFEKRRRGIKRAMGVDACAPE